MPAALLKRDAELRGEIGAPDVGQLAIVRADTPEAVLQAEEKAEPVLDHLLAAHAMAGVEFAARLLPSVHTQRSRQAELPAAAVLHDRVEQAAQGLGFTTHAFDPFEQAVAAARTQPPLTIAGMAASPLHTRLDALLFERDGNWYGPVIPTAVADAARFRAAFAARPGWSFIDVQQTTGEIVAGYTRQAWPFLAGGCAAAILVLLLAQRDPLRTGRILAAIAATILVSVAVLVVRGRSLSLIHLVALQFVAGIGLDYALFFARTQLDAEERARTLRTLVTCNIMALLTFSLLSLCRTPLLRQIGETVSLGVVLAFCFAFLFAGPHARLEPR